MLNKFRLTFNSPAIMTYIFICTVALGLHIYTGGATDDWIFSIYGTRELSLPLIARLFLHICGYTDLHTLVAEMVVLLAIGPMIEEKFMSRKVVSVMIAVALVTSIPVFFPFTGAHLMGGRGVIAALLVLGSFTGDKDGSTPFSFLVIMAALISYEGYLVYMSGGNEQVWAEACEVFIGTGLGAYFVYK